MRVRAMSWTVVLLCFSVQLLAQAKSTEVPLAGPRRLVFTHPASWSVETRVDGPSHTVTLRPGKKAGYKVIVIARDEDDVTLSDDDLAELVRRSHAAHFPKAGEAKLVRVEGAQARGYLFAVPATDGRPNEEGTAQGVVLVGPYFLSVTIAADGWGTPIPSDALKVLSEISHTR